MKLFRESMVGQHGILSNNGIDYANELKFWNEFYIHTVHNYCKFGTILMSIDKNMAIQNLGLSPTSAPP